MIEDALKLRGGFRAALPVSVRPAATNIGSDNGEELATYVVENQTAYYTVK